MLGGNLVLQTANNPGTSTFNLIAPPAARASFVAACGIGQVYYFASDAASWEVGVGTVASGSPDTLSRDTVLGNSLATTAKINFTGQVLLTNETPAERDVWASADNTSLLVGGRKLSGVLPGVAVDDAPRVGQLAWQRIGSGDSNMGGTSGAAFALPSGYSRFRIDWTLTVPSGGGYLYAQLSTNGGSSYDNAQHYPFSLRDIGAGTDSNQLTGTFIPLNNARTGGRYEFGSLVIDGSGIFGIFDDFYTGSTVSSIRGGYSYSFGAPTNIIVGISGGTFTGGVVGLFGRRA